MTTAGEARDRGASIMMLAISLMLLIGASALAVDLAGLWMERSIDQKITDSAASAGALEVAISGSEDACERALDYVAVNSEEIASLSSSDCATLPANCTTGTPGVTVNVPWARGTVSLTYPVTDADPLMDSGLIGGGTPTAHADDGLPCERFGVKMTATRENLFAQLLGFNQGTTSVHTVATAAAGEGDPPINLLVLDRHNCEAIKVRGNGGILVKAVLDVDPVTGTPTGVAQGLAAADSDGTGSLCSSSGVVAVEGDHSLLRADGPQGCGLGGGTYPVGSYTAEERCGAIQTYAPNSGGCGSGGANLPSCSPGSGGSNKPKPVPTALSRPHTRQTVDHIYNCYGDYDWSSGPPTDVSWATDALTVANEQNIEDCQDATGSNDYVYNLIDLVGAAPGTPSEPGWDTWSSLGNPCTVDPGTALPPQTGNVVIDCADFEVKDPVTIDGNVVFDGDVSVTSGTGNLEINNDGTPWGWIFFRGGILSKDAQAKLTFVDKMVYMSKTSQVSLSGGSGSLTWIAPDTGDKDEFDDLAFWSDSPLDHNWAGQSDLKMEGVFFMPQARMIYTGTSGMNQTDAQWIADRLEAGGSGRLVISPSVGRSVSFSGPRTVLIR